MVYITGYTTSSDFPVQQGYYGVNASTGKVYYTGRVSHGGSDAFIAEINTYMSGTASLMASTYWGGSGDDAGYGIAAESDGRVSIVGQTTSTDFPNWNGQPMQTASAGSTDAFLVKLRPGSFNGMAQDSGYTYSIYLGGSSYDYGYALAVDTAGRVYLTGDTLSSNFPVWNATQTYQGTDGCVVKVFPQTEAACHWPYSGYRESIGYTFDSTVPVTSTWRTTF